VNASIFVGTSLDGFIARTDGAFDFLPQGGGEPHGYDEFMATVDALVSCKASTWWRSSAITHLHPRGIAVPWAIARGATTAAAPAVIGMTSRALTPSIARKVRVMRTRQSQ